MNKDKAEFWSGAVFIGAVVLLAILFAGTPDLMDAIIKHVSSCS